MKQLLRNAWSIPIFILAIFVVRCKEDGPIPKVTASFTQAIDNATGTVKFTNTSKNATSYSWDLGNGKTSTEFEPVGTYETGTYTVKLTASNTTGQSDTSENSFTVNVPGGGDTTLPIITLKGEATINLAVGDSYTDQGATANDNLDGDISANIAVGGDTVNTAVAGTYVITYNVKDAAGNSAAQVTRTVIVGEKTFDDGLLTNGDFSSTTEAWSGNGFNVRSEGGGSFNFANVTVAGNPYDVNLSQMLKLTRGANYVLSFKASSDRSRTMIAGIGLNEEPFTNASKSVNLKKDTLQAFTLEFSTATFGGDNSRVFFDMGAEVGVVIIDDVSLVLGNTSSCTLKLPINFDDCDSAVYNFETFNGAGYKRVDNPNLSGVNNVASKVGEITNTGKEWEGGGFNLATPVSFATLKSFKIKVYSTASLPVLLKFEDTAPEGSQATPPIEKAANHGGTGWEDLAFNFNSTDEFDKLVLFIDGPGTTSGTFYFDDIIQVAGSGGGSGGCTDSVVVVSALPATFEACQSFTSTFNNDGSITTELADNPSTTGNSSKYCLKVVKASGTNRWAGFQNKFASNLDLTKTFKLKVYSSKANVVMRFEVNADPASPSSGNPAPQYRTITQANTWQEVEVLFTGVPDNNTGVNQLVIKPDNPANIEDSQLTDTAGTYYFDDITLETATGGGG